MELPAAAAVAAGRAGSVTERPPLPPSSLTISGSSLPCASVFSIVSCSSTQHSAVSPREPKHISCRMQSCTGQPQTPADRPTDRPTDWPPSALHAGRGLPSLPLAAAAAVRPHQVEQQQLLHQVVLGGQHVANNGDEDAGELLARQDGRDGLLHRVHLGLLVARLQRQADLILGELQQPASRDARRRQRSAAASAAAARRPRTAHRAAASSSKVLPAPGCNPIGSP